MVDNARITGGSRQRERTLLEALVVTQKASISYLDKELSERFFVLSVLNEPDCLLTKRKTVRARTYKVFAERSYLNYKIH